MCYHIEFGRSASKDVKEFQNGGALWLRSLPVGVELTPRNTPLSTCVILQNLVVLGQTM